MKVVFLGATSGMGRALARELAARGAQIVLLGRDAEQLRRSAADLEIHGAVAPVSTAFCDLTVPETFAPALQEAERALPGWNTLILTAGLFDVQDELEKDLHKLQEMLSVNFTNTILLCELAKERLLARGGGTLCVFTSVAGQRARKPVVLYGASKAGLSYYLEGLDHRYHDRGLRVIDVRPGFVRTRMTMGLEPPPFSAAPEEVARVVAQALVRGRPVVYAPGIWRLVMFVIRRLPRFVMRRVSF